MKFHRWILPFVRRKPYWRIFKKELETCILKTIRQPDPIQIFWGNITSISIDVNWYECPERRMSSSSRSYNNSFPVPQLLVVPDKANTNRGRNSKLMPIDLFLQIATPTWSVHRFPSHFLSKFIWGFLWYLLSIFDSTFLIYSYMSLIYICSMSLQYFPGYSRFQIYVSVYPDIISADYSKENNLKRIIRKK